MCRRHVYNQFFFLLLLALHVNRHQLHTRYAKVMCGNGSLPIPNIGFEYLKCCEANRKMWYLSQRLSCSDFPIKIVLSFRFSSIRSPTLIIRFCRYCWNRWHIGYARTLASTDGNGFLAQCVRVLVGVLEFISAVAAKRRNSHLHKTS